jgi:hypothetical protein
MPLGVESPAVKKIFSVPSSLGARTDCVQRASDLDCEARAVEAQNIVGSAAAFSRFLGRDFAAKYVYFFAKDCDANSSSATVLGPPNFCRR